jgi:16S rRNA (guanine966-N2)-methyltransferase
MAREAIFSMLASRGGVEGLVVADLYCGSGALGIEALSRGAKAVYFYDHDQACINAAKANLEPLGLPGDAIFVRTALPNWRPPEDLDLVLADPPYGSLDIDALLAPTSAERAVIENDRWMPAPPGWTVEKEKRYGTTLVTVLVRTEGEEHE